MSAENPLVYRLTPTQAREVTYAVDCVHWSAVTALSAAGRSLHVVRQGVIRPDPDQHQWAVDMATLLNGTDLRHDGFWSVVWHHPRTVTDSEGLLHLSRPSAWSMVFLDHDGDVQFRVECTDPLFECWAAGTHHFGASAEEAWRVWKDRLDGADVRPDQQIKRAAGQRSLARLRAERGRPARTEPARAG